MRTAIINTKSTKYRRFLRHLHSRTTRAVWGLMVDSGLRVGDAVQITRDDVKRGAIKEQKTGKIRQIPTTSPHLRGQGNSEFIFPSTRNNTKHISRATIYRHVKAAAKAAGLDNIGCHSARKIYAWNLYQSTGDIYAVQRALGHDSVSTTLHYLFLSPKA